jgi:hypothetical protein
MATNLDNISTPSAQALGTDQDENVNAALTNGTSAKRTGLTQDKLDAVLQDWCADEKAQGTEAAALNQSELLKAFHKATWPDVGRPLLATDAFKPGDPGKGIPFDSPDAMMEEAKRLTEQGRNVWLTDAGFGDIPSPKKDLRHKNNVLSRRTLGGDIDTNDGYPQAKRQDDGRYETKEEAIEALERVREKLGLPQPWVTDSGHGIQTRSPFDKSAPVERWKPVAEALKRANAKEDPRLMVDPSKWADPAGLLRYPVSINRKPDCEPAEASILQIGETKPFEWWEDWAKLHGEISPATKQPTSPVVDEDEPDYVFHRGKQIKINPDIFPRKSLGELIRGKQLPLENVPEEYRADLKFNECIPHLQNSKVFDPKTRDGCRNFALA